MSPIQHPKVVVHVAGALDAEGLQRCTRCGYILSDYRNTMVPEGSPPLRGWRVGAAVEVIAGSPKYTGLTTAPPNC